MHDFSRRAPTRRQFLTHGGALAAATAGLAAPTVRAQSAPLKVGIAYVSPIAPMGWTRQHDLARRAMEAAFPGRVQTTVVENISNPADAVRVFREMAQSGHKLIFGTSFSHLVPLQQVAADFPDVAFEHCSGIKTLPNLGIFEARYYEGTYLAGVIAGAMSKSGTIGFIGGFPVPDIVGPANALLIGARSVNPKVRCKPLWLNSWFDPPKEQNAATTLLNLGADVLVSMTDTPTTVMVGEERGAWTIGYASDMRPRGPKRQLTSFMLDWSSLYIDAARRVLAGNWKPTARWDGLKAGVVKMAPYNPAIPADVLQQVAQKERAIIEGRLQPFAGPLKDLTGKPRAAAGGVLDEHAIRSMNWLVEGMEGGAI
jgi:basic membrane protein A